MLVCINDHPRKGENWNDWKNVARKKKVTVTLWFCNTEVTLSKMFWRDVESTFFPFTHFRNWTRVDEKTRTLWKHEAWTSVGTALSSSHERSRMFHYWMKTRKGSLYFLSWNELWKYFVPFQRFDNSFLRIFSVLISLPVYIMNDSWLELVRVTAVKLQLSFCSQGCCSINSRVYWRHCQLKCHRRLSV